MRELSGWYGAISGLLLAFGVFPAWSQTISFTNDVQPIFEAKCVACHACYDAPAQLDLTNAIGVQRGALKLDPYVPRMTAIEPTVLRASPNTVEDWRARGFFSVIEGGADSIMAKMIRLGRDNPVDPNARFTDSVELDSLSRKNFMPNAAEIDGYVAAHPLEGMPLAVAGLTDAEYATIMAWLEQNAPFDNEAPVATDVELAKIAEWETFLNGEDNRSRLIARYIFEHAYLFEFYFADEGLGNTFHLIRSQTPPGESPLPVAAQMANSDVEGPFWYRLAVSDRTRCAKLHQLTLDASGDKLDRYKRIFFETDWDVEELPGYSMAERVDPLNTFAAIPARARWKYLLADVWLHRGTIAWGPVCRGDLTVGSVQDVEWDFFEDPETSLYVNDAEYREALAPYLALPEEPEDLIAVMASFRNFIERRKEALTEAMERLSESDGSRSRITDIWRGDEPGDTPMLVIYRNDDNAYPVRPGTAVGALPKTTWVLDLPILERMIYASVVNFDLFGSVAVWLGNRESFGIDRRAAELNFLRFLPQEDRREIYESWYQGPLSDERRRLEQDIIDLGPDVSIPTGIAFETDDPKSEFQTMLLEHVRFTDIDDPINRPRAGDEGDAITQAFRSIVAAAAEQEPTWRNFKTMLPEATFLRIDVPEGEPLVYTMTLDRELGTKAFALSILQEEDPSRAKLTIYPGILTAYPNFIFRIDEAEVGDFATALIAAETSEAFTEVVERWGVRRSDPDFWEVVHSMTDYVRRTDPPRAGVFDVNRYKNL
jgi:hypothetical protein